MISIPRLAVNRPVGTIMVFLGLCLFGFLALLRLPVELMPNATFDTITIFIGVRGGLPPPQIEELITRPVEESVSRVGGLANIVSTSKMNRSVVTLEFEPGTDMDFASLEVREHFSSVSNKLPRDIIEKPVIARYEEQDYPIYILAITAERHAPEEIREVVENKLKDRILRVNGVANVEINGGRERKIMVELKPSRLQALKIPVSRVITAISLANVEVLDGDVSSAELMIAVKTHGAFKNLEELQNLPIETSETGGIVRLKDIADVEDSFLEAQSYARISSQGNASRDAVSVYVQKESGANTVMVSRRIESRIEEFKKEIGKEFPDMVLHSVQVQARHIQSAISTVLRSLAFGAVLAIGILLLFFRRIQYTAVVAAVIPLSVMTAFTLMYVSGISINIISLSGLALGIGMLLDNSIVVLENILQRLHGKDVISSAEEMTAAVIASTLTTIIVFLPITFFSREIRMLYADLSLTVTYSLVASLFVALSAVPLFASRLAKEKNTQQSKNIMVNRCVRSFLRRYRCLLAHVLRRRYQVLSAVLVLIVVSMVVYAKFLEKDLRGESEYNEFTIYIELDAGVQLEVSKMVVEAIEQRLTAIPDVHAAIKTAQSRIEGWSSKIYVSLVSKDKRLYSAKKMIAVLREDLKSIERRYEHAGAFIHFSDPRASREFVVEVYGYDYDTIAGIANTVAMRMSQYTDKHAGKGFTDIKLRYRPGRPTYDFIIDKDKAASLEVSVKEAADSFHAQLRGMRASFYRTGAAELEIVPRLKAEFRDTPAKLDELTVVNARGDVIPAKNLLAPAHRAGRFSIIPSEINRKNKSRMIQVSGTLERISLARAAAAVRQVIAGLELPKHYYCDIGGEYEKMIRNQKEFAWGIILSLLLVYAVLASLFESYIQPFLIMVTVPVALVGVVAALCVTVRVVTMGVFIGIIMLGGIVVNNAIILIDRMNAVRKEHPADSAFLFLRHVMKTGTDRLRPVLMTTLTTVLGLVPMALDRSDSSNLWAPLAITVIGGLTVSTFLTLILLPTLYVASVKKQ